MHARGTPRSKDVFTAGLGSHEREPGKEGLRTGSELQRRQEDARMESVTERARAKPQSKRNARHSTHVKSCAFESCDVACSNVL